MIDVWLNAKVVYQISTGNTTGKTHLVALVDIWQKPKWPTGYLTKSHMEPSCRHQSSINDHNFRLRKIRHQPDVSLSDEHTSVMNALGQPELEDLGLQTSLQEIIHTKTQHVIELHFGLIQHSNTHQTSQQGVTCKDKES